MQADLAGCFFALMQRRFTIRSWCAAVACGLLGLSLQTVAATTPSKKPAKSSRSAAAKAKHPAGRQATAAHSSITKSKHSRTKTKSRSSRKRGQKAIDAERARQIQEALIREHYLDGEPSGRWDDATQTALRRYQADQGWQSKAVPDSRALIKLGLGPNHDHLLNPESAMTTVPVAVDPKAPARPSATNPPAQPAPSSDTSPPQP